MTIAARIDTLAERATRDREAFQRPADPPAEDRAMTYLREGAGPAVMVYVDARTNEWHRFEPESFERLEDAMNTWFELYAACYGVDIEAEFTIRKAAEALLETHNIHDVARVLTHVPET
jgi:hypothetical protein